MTRILTFLLLAAHASAATKYVTKAGSDSADGSIGTPWLTITKAAASLVGGDTVIIGNGDYDEHVQESTSGSVGNLITYQAENAGMVSLRAFRMSGAYLKLDGLKISAYSAIGNTWNAGVRVESGSDNCTITNCTFTDYPCVIASDFTFDNSDDSVTSLSSDFVEAGFKVGSKVYLGASGATVDGVPLFYVNHDTSWTVATVTATKMTLTSGSATFLDDPGGPYWGIIRAGSTSGGYPAVIGIRSGGIGPNGLTISNCTVSDWAANVFDLKGDDCLVHNNSLTDLKSFQFISFSGSNYTITRNLIRNTPGVLHYAAAEFDTVVHPAGTGWYDYQIGMMSGFTNLGGTHENVLIEENWFENVENQLGRVDDELETASGIIYNRNVFIGVADHFSGGRDDMEWTNNTFYRCTSYGSLGAAHPLAIGGRPPAQTGYNIQNNIFVACGPKGVTEAATRGFYGISDNATSPVTDYNHVAGEEVTGYASKSNFSETNGVNGGDPVFYDVTNYLGPDGLPFTADDGLQILPSSPIAALGGGGCGVYEIVSGEPVAHFRITSPSGWFEPTGEAYNPAWFETLPTLRGGLQRPFDTPVQIGDAPVECTFNAEHSMSGVAGASTNTAITNYSWDWGDGSADTNTAATTADHTFATAGDFTVTLTVTNSDTNTHSVTRIYRVTGDTPAAPTNLRGL